MMTPKTDAKDVQVDFAKRCWDEVKARPGYAEERARILEEIAEDRAKPMSREDLERLRQSVLDR